MLAYTYIEHGKFKLLEKPRPEIRDSRDAIIRVTLSSICTSDLHIKHGSVPRAIPGITVGHEMVGVVEQIGADVLSVTNRHYSSEIFLPQAFGQPVFQKFLKKIRYSSLEQVLREFVLYSAQC